jgi:putative DNA primase/helicase
MSDPFAPLAGDPSPARGKPQDEWEPIWPVPDDAPKPPLAHYKRGAPSLAWQYQDAEGKLLGHVWRFDGGESGKEFMPLTYCRKSDGSSFAWRFKSWPAARPLYGLRQLAERSSASVLVCEGEKAADAARSMLPALAVVTSPGGSKAAAKADWSSLRGRDVAIWPDNDKPGAAYAEEVAKLAVKAGALSVVIIQPPAIAPEGWDAADAKSEGFTSAQLQTLIASAKIFTPRVPAIKSKAEGVGEDAQGERKRPRQSNELIALVDSLQVDLWIDEDSEAFASFPVGNHRENRSLRSREFRRWLAGQQWRATGGASTVQALEDSLRVFEARAFEEGGRFKTYRRVGEHNGKIYIDLCDEDWRAVEVSALGWEVVNNPPCKFIRGGAMRALPEPELGGSVSDFMGYFAFDSEAEFQLIVAWCVQALRPRGPYPLLIVNGEQGAGKSNLTAFLRALTDPNASPLRSAPDKDRDLFVAAENQWVLALDNLSSVQDWLSDALCRIATGGGFSTRELHSDKGETVFFLARPCILNGIPALTNRPDLADRAITVFLKAIPPDKRRTEAELWKAFNKIAPSLLGCLLDGVSAGLRNIDKVQLVETPRMADFAQWAVATESGLGFEQGSTLAAYVANRKDLSQESFEADPVAGAIAKLATSKGGLDCKVAELLTMLTEAVSDNVSSSRSWPRSSTALGARIRRIAPLLRSQGFLIDWGHSGNRYVRVVPPSL